MKPSKTLRSLLLAGAFIALTSACSKDPFRTSYDSKIKEMNLALSSASTRDAWEHSDQNPQMWLASYEQSANKEGASICDFLADMPMDIMYSYYLAIDSDPKLQTLKCRTEIIKRVEDSLKPKPVVIDPNVEVMEGFPEVPYPNTTAQPAPKTKPSVPVTSAPKNATPKVQPKVTPKTSQNPLLPAKAAPLQQPSGQPKLQSSSQHKALGINPRTGEKLEKILIPDGSSHTFSGLKKFEVALTFDDGPHNRLTPILLDVLKREGVYATFFTVGKNVLRYPEIVKRAQAEGHVIAAHSFSHAKFTEIGFDNSVLEIRDSFNALLSVLGKVSALFRFPYRATDAALKNYLKSQGIADSGATVDTLDWKYPKTSELLARTITQINTVQSGAILFHDIQPQTIAIMPDLIRYLRSKGYKTYTLRGQGNVVSKQSSSQR